MTLLQVTCVVQATFPGSTLQPTVPFQRSFLKPFANPAVPPALFPPKR